MTRAKRKTRTWTEPEKAQALARLLENGGNVKKTVREFRTADDVRVTETNLRRWRANPAERPAVKLFVEAKRDRRTTLRSILQKLEQGMDAALDEYPELVPLLVRKHPRDLATTIGILTDKLLLLEGKATEITEQRTLSSFLSTAKWLDSDEKAETDAKLN